MLLVNLLYRIIDYYYCAAAPALPRKPDDRVKGLTPGRGTAVRTPQTMPPPAMRLDLSKLASPSAATPTKPETKGAQEPGAHPHSSQARSRRGREEACHRTHHVPARLGRDSF